MAADHSIGDLETKNLMRVPYPAVLRTAVGEAVALWRAFCALPESERVKFPYDSSAGMGVGYELKKTPGANLDLKEDFHFASGSKDWLADIAKKIGDDAVMRFIEGAASLSHAMEPLVLQFARDIEQEFSLEGFADDVAAGRAVWFIRFLHYFGDRSPGDEIAIPHADKSSFTLHLYESDPGLEYLDFEKKWQEMPVSVGETAIIPGMRLQYRSHNRIKATYHRVVVTQETAAHGRFSAVCFIHSTNTPANDKQKFGRLQEFQPGFNYDMPWDEFSKLFVA